MYDKPFKTFDELLDVLFQRHNLNIPDSEIAKGIITFIPYYDLVNGYKEILMDGEKFSDGTDAMTLFLFHVFDHDFQNALFAPSVSIENYFKNILAYVLAESFGVSTDEYLRYSHYLPKRRLGNAEVRRDRIIPKLKDIAFHTPDNPTKFYRNHHNHIPPWILLKNVSFSQSIDLLRLLKRTEKNKILEFMIPIHESPVDCYPVLLYTLTIVRRCRNTIAHNLKFTSFDCSRYMNNLSKKSLRKFISPLLLSDEELDTYKFLGGIYGYIILSLSLIPDKITKMLIVHRLLSTFLLKNDGILFSPVEVKIRSKYFEGLNIPSDIRERLLAFVNNLCKSIN